MSSSILTPIMSMLDTHGVTNLSARLGEPEPAVSNGIMSSVAAMIGGLANKADQPSSMRQIFDLVSSAPSDVNVSNLVSAALSSGGAAAATSPLLETGKKLLSMIFGDKQNAVSNAVGRTSGLSSSTAGQLMGMAAPLLLSVLGRRVREGGLTASSLRSDLVAEAAGIKQLLPTGFTNLLGSVTQPVADASRAVAFGAQETARSSWRWVWPIAAVAALLFAFWGLNRATRRVDVGQVSNVVSSTAERMRVAVADLGEFIIRKLPGNIDLRIPERGVEGRLLSFIESSSTASNATWFDFDRLVFDTDSATLRPESQEQLQNIATILKAYPRVRVKIGGYTDNTGAADANLKLSQARASNVVAELTRLGVSSDRLQAEGYGAQHPVADNSTEEGRSKNRRISIRVTGL
jgi:OmpA-OmpF porin, OOP family